jgi:hypothetical protein
MDKLEGKRAAFRGIVHGERHTICCVSCLTPKSSLVFPPMRTKQMLNRKFPSHTQ